MTLYGNDPHYRPDIYGKIGTAGVSICCLDDAKKLYSRFRFGSSEDFGIYDHQWSGTNATCSFFMNAAIDQQCEIYIKENGLEEEVEAKIDRYI